MKQLLSFKTLFAMSIAIVILSGCVSSTMIKSIPSGAKVYINGEPVGKTPYLHVDTRVSFTTLNIDIIKEGYEPIYTKIRRDGEFNVGTFVGGFFIWPIWLWTMDYQNSHTYELVPSALLNNNNQNELPIENNISPLRPKVDRLKELKQLLDEKVITENDYNTQKQKILDEK
jgi:hypothetical protein